MNKRSRGKIPGKYGNIGAYFFAKVKRDLLRNKIKNMVTWKKVEKSELADGCTLVMGMVSSMPMVLRANLNCVVRFPFSNLVKVIIVVDNVKGSLPHDFEESVIKDFGQLSIEFLYYSQDQHALADSIRLPFVFSWLSWCIGFSKVTTKSILIQDYDALILGDVLNLRYSEFLQSKSLFQGISWYAVNGIVESDQLATTFEAIIDTSWVRGFRPIKLFNQIGMISGRSVDYDTLLDIQQNWTALNERSIYPMGLSDLVHPSQMIHQYTMFRRHPGKALPCYSIIMIPFFNFMGGDVSALEKATRKLNQRESMTIELFDDSVLINFEQLEIAHIDWMLKQMVEVMVSFKHPPFRTLFDYGSELYSLVKAPKDLIWKGDFTLEHREWISLSQESDA